MQEQRQSFSFLVVEDNVVNQTLGNERRNATNKASYTGRRCRKILVAYVSGLREGNVPHVSIVPQAGQVVREVQVPEELARLDFGPDTFSKYRLRVTGAEAALVKHNK